MEERPAGVEEGASWELGVRVEEGDGVEEEAGAQQVGI